MNAEISKTVKATKLGFGVENLEVLAQHTLTPITLKPV